MTNVHLPDNESLLDPAYAVPSLEEGSPYAFNGGAYSVELTDGVTGIPDGRRLGNFPSRDQRPDPTQPSSHYWNQYNANKVLREYEAHEEQVTIQGGIKRSPQKFAPLPLSTPPPEDRWTMGMSPNTYSYTRLFDQGMKSLGEREFNGSHFSQADLMTRRQDILGMEPSRTRRNTYRIEPSPWDQNIVDYPPEQDPDYMNARYQQDFDETPNVRSWRLS